MSVEEVARKRTPTQGGTASCGLLHADPAHPTGVAALADVPITDTHNDCGQDEKRDEPSKPAPRPPASDSPHASQAIQITRKRRRPNLIRFSGATNIDAALRHHARTTTNPIKLVLTS